MRLSPAIVVCTLLAMLLSPVGASAATVTIDGAPVTGVIVHEGHLLVPFRAPMEQIGATVNWSDETQTGSAVISGQEIVRAIIGQPTAIISGYPKVLDVAPVLIEHLEYVPVEMLPEISSAQLTMSPDGSTATITNFDLAGINAAGQSAASIDPHGRVLYLWVWLLPISGVLCILAYLAATRQIMRRRRPA